MEEGEGGEWMLLLRKNMTRTDVKRNELNTGVLDFLVFFESIPSEDVKERVRNRNPIMARAHIKEQDGTTPAQLHLQTFSSYTFLGVVHVDARSTCKITWGAGDGHGNQFCPFEADREVEVYYRWVDVEDGPELHLKLNYPESPYLLDADFTPWKLFFQKNLSKREIKNRELKSLKDNFRHFFEDIPNEDVKQRLLHNVNREAALPVRIDTNQGCFSGNLDTTDSYAEPIDPQDTSIEIQFGSALDANRNTYVAHTNLFVYYRWAAGILELAIRLPQEAEPQN